MTRILFLADLHGNYTATLAMEKEIEKIAPDEIWFLGDAVGKGPQNDKTCDWVRSHCDHFLKGNWDEWVCYAYRNRHAPDDQKNPYEKSLRFYWEQIGEERISWIESLPQEAELWISGLRFRIIHGRNIDQLYQGYDPDDRLKEGLLSGDKKTKYDHLIFADSHRPFLRALDCGYVLNTGSIGNAICLPRASALLIEGDLGSQEPSPIYFTSIEIPYNNQEAADIALATPGLPLAESYAKEVLTGEYSR